MRVRAYQREQAWAPRRVANELAGTIQAADQQRANATLRTAQAQAEQDPEARQRLTREAAEAAALADTLEQHTSTLQDLDDAWTQWYVHTAGTRAAADRAHAELANRHVGAQDDGQRVTAAEWLAAHAETLRAEDEHREITEADLAEDLGEFERAKAHVRPADTIDLREQAAADDAPADQDTVRVPTAEETTDSVRRAERALAEIRARDAADTNAAAEARAEQLTRWHTDDARAVEDEATTYAEPVMERADHV
jgi:hypothetical protein